MATTNQFIAVLATVISKCRDILRREGITGMDSMKHLTLYTLLRRLDDAECKKLKISNKFSWEKFQELKDNHQASYDLLYCKSGVADDLISHLDNTFGTKNFNFKLSNPTNHVDILKEFGKLDFDQLDANLDVLGTIYEIHLGSGSNKSAMRDLGQFFTERDVCKYMVKLCDPKILADGRPESILDPSMGTGGFLTSYVNHIGSSIDWSSMKDDIVGCDIDDFVMSVGKINLYLQTGILFPRVEHRDSLYNDVGTDAQRRKFKLILANMPFGVKGLKHASCCKRVKDLHLDGTKSEPLFLQLMMASLDDGGRCAVVVPDGVLVNQSKCHNGTRKYLLDNFELKRVIKMKGQFFSNTGIQPSILFFENTGKPTSTVEFWDVERTSGAGIAETMVVSVPREKIDTDSYSLDMRRYIETVVSESHSAFPMVKLGDILISVKGTRYNVSDGKDSGKYPLIRSSSDGSVKWMDEYTYEGPLLAVGNGGAANFHYAEKFNASTHTLVYDCHETVNKKYIYYILNHNKNKITDSCFKGTGLKNLKLEDFNNFMIPLPPLEIQQQVVAELDDIYEYASNCAKLADNNMRQMKSIMKTVGMRGYERNKILDLVNIEGGDYITKKDELSGNYPVYGGGTASYHINRYNREPTCVINKDGMSESCVQIVNERFFLNHHGWTLKSRSCNIVDKFLHWQLYFRSNEIYSLATGSCQKGLNQKEFAKLSIYTPPLEVQNHIVDVMDALDAELKIFKGIISKSDERAKFVLDGYIQNAI